MYFINKDKPKISYDPIQKNRQEIYKLINDKKLNSTKEGKLTITIYRAMTCGFIGEACTDNPDDGDKNYQKSIFGFMGNLIALPYANPPASGVYWAYSGLQNAGFIPKTYAAEGIGFAAIKPFMNLWKVFRDIAYMLLVLVLIAIGFMIMFRMKLNPQTVISVENSLPRIVISLLLITFSFAIAGFLIDLMYIIMAISISILSDAGKNFPEDVFKNKYLNATPSVLEDAFFPVQIDSLIPNELKPLKNFFNTFLSLIKVFIPSTINSVQKIINLILISFNLFLILPPIVHALMAIITAIGSFLITDKIVDFLRNGTGILQVIDNWTAATFGWGKTPSAILAILLTPIIFILAGVIFLPLVVGILVLMTIIFLFFRVFFLLLTTYLRIILFIIFSPVILIFEAIPGKNAFSYWFKNLLAELLTFPIVLIILLVGYIISNKVALGFSVGTNFWVPPFLYGLHQLSYVFLIGIGLIFLIPDLVKLVKEMMGIKPMPISIGLGTFFSGVGAGYSGAMASLQQFSGLASFPGISTLMGKIPGVKTLKTHLIPPSQGSLTKAQTKTLLEGQGLPPDEVDKMMKKFSEELLGPTTPPKTGGGH